MVQDRGTEVTDSEAYRKRILDMLGDRDPVEVLAQTAGELQRIVDEHPRERLCHRPFEGKWTPTEIIGHLVDAEWVFGVRLRSILSEERPTLAAFDQERWVQAQRHNEADPAALVAKFRTLREMNLPVWRRLAPEQLRRCGLHNRRGDESLETVRRLTAGHDLSHLDQIRRYLAAGG